MAAPCWVALLAPLVLRLARAAELPVFESFMEVHGRSYQTESAEFHERRAIYERRRANAELHNSNPKRLWTAGVNRFWDWTEPELKTLRGYDPSGRPEGGSARSVQKHATFLQQAAALPEEKLWTHLAMSSHIQNQGSCGACWATAAAGCLEAHAEIHGKPRTFSAQQIIKCTPNPRHCGGDGGCKGATAELAMDWVLKNGVDTTADYDNTCMAGTPTSAMSLILKDRSSGTKGGSSFGMTGWETLPKNQYEPFVRALVEKGPVAVHVAADTWFDYDSGIFNGCQKDAIIDHSVLVMGYGKDSGTATKFWAIQNSWGKDWGEQGHMRLERLEGDGYCGMDNDPQKGVGCKGENDPVPVCGMCGILFDAVVPHFTS